MKIGLLPHRWATVAFEFCVGAHIKEIWDLPSMCGEIQKYLCIYICKMQMQQ